MNKIVIENRRITIRKVAEDVGILVGSYHAIFRIFLGMKRVSAKFVPKLLNFEEKNRCMSIAQELLNDVNNNSNLLRRAIIGDEIWEYGYDVDTKAQSSQWKRSEEPRPKKARLVR